MINPDEDFQGFNEIHRSGDVFRVVNGRTGKVMTFVLKDEDKSPFVIGGGSNKPQLLDDAIRFQLQTRVLELHEEDVALQFELEQLNAKIRHLGKRQSDARKVLMSLLVQLGQTYLSARADVERTVYGSCDPELEKAAKDSQNLIYPEQSTAPTRVGAEESTVQ